MYEDESIDTMDLNAIDIAPAFSVYTSIPADIACEPGGAYNNDSNSNFDRDNPLEDVQLLEVDISDVLKAVPKDPIQASQYFLDGKRAMIDTGAKVTCTHELHLLHGYKPYNTFRRCPVRITAAIDGEKLGIIPEGSGYLHIPAPNQQGYISVFCYYSPRLSSTLVSENGLYGSDGRAEKEFSGQSIHKFFQTNNVTIISHHKMKRSNDVIIHGILIDGQMFTHPLMIPDLDIESPYANCITSSAYAVATDEQFRKECDKATDSAISKYRTDIWHDINLSAAPKAWTPFVDIIEESIPVHSIKAKTLKLLWHQRLGHPCDEYLYNAHKYIDGVPKFSRQTPILDQCPTCIQAKQTKQPPGPNSTRVATQPYQGMSIDFSFSGGASKNSNRRKDYEGINGETAWIIVTDHFTGMKHGDTRISKAAPLHWLEHFLGQYSPDCSQKYVHLDQGGELFNNPFVKKLFQLHGYEILPTGADTSRQNGPAERAHRTLANSIRALLTGANLPIKFWPYAFYHALRLSNAFPERGRTSSPLELATSRKENLSDFRTFGCRVWVRPPGRKSAKFKPNSRKGLFLGFVPYTTRNILWYDEQTTRVKIATHARFDEGMNDLPFSDIPPNVRHLQRADDGNPLPPEPTTVTASDFDFSITPFVDLLNHRISRGPDPLLGLDIRDDGLLHRAYVFDVAPQSPAASLYSSHKAARSALRGAYILNVNFTRVFTATDAKQALQRFYERGVDDAIVISFAPVPKLTAKRLRQHTNEYGLFAPSTNWKDDNTDDEDPPFLDRSPIHFLDKNAAVSTIQTIRNRFRKLSNKAIAKVGTRETLHAYVQQTLAPIEDDMAMVVPTLDIHSLRAITRLHKPGNKDLPINETETPNALIDLVINAINSKSTTPEEQALGHFTRRKLKGLDTWDEWEAGERKQLNQFSDLQMYGEAILPPKDPNTIILRPHWQYHIKRDGTRRARQCCNGSKYAAPLLHAIAMTYSSCVEHPIQRLFFAIAANLNLRVYGGDAKDAYGHSPGPDIPTFMTIDNQYADWYRYKYGKEIDRKKVLPVLRALQGHPESGRLWETHINKILKGPTLRFKTTTHDRTIYTTDFEGETVYLLRQVDDFALACTKQSIADKIYDIIGEQLKLPKEDKIPFTKMGLIDDFNGIDVKQTKDYIQLSCANYIDRIMTSHGWETCSSMKPTSKPNSPLSTEVLNHLQNQKGPLEGTQEHQQLQDKQGFSYRTLLGEMMFAYVSCRPDIGYAITLMSKFASNPSPYHYKCLKDIAKYLRTTREWGIMFSKTVPDPELPESEIRTEDNSTTNNLPEYPEDITQGKLICFVDAAYGNDVKNRRSTTGYAFTYAGGAVVYRSKAQSITAQSSTEAEFIAAVTAAKTARYIRSVLTELGFEQKEPTPIYEDNVSAIDIINAQKPTERTRHIEIRFFGIQDWKARGDIKLTHIPGVINPADDLTKPLGWVLHARHARYMMGHFNVLISNKSPSWKRD